VDIVGIMPGIFQNRSIDELDLADMAEDDGYDLDAHFLSAKYFLPGMRRKSGPFRRHIVKHESAWPYPA